MGLVERQYDKYIWALKFRPNNFNDLVMPERLKKKFQSIVDEQNIPNMLFSGIRGCGKTSSAFIMADLIGCDTLYINMSKETGIDTIRNQMSQFATTMSLKDGKKLIIGDEFDRLSSAAIDSLKGDIEEYSKNCSFIFTSNNKHKLIDHPVMSRLEEVDFVFSKEETVQMKKEFAKRVCVLLKNEGIKFVPKTILKFVNFTFPDFRKVFTELQNFSKQFDVINDDTFTIFTSIQDINLLFNAIKEKDFAFIKSYVANLSVDFNTVYSALYKQIEEYIELTSFPFAIKMIADWQYKSAFSADKMIPLNALFIELATDCDWK